MKTYTRDIDFAAGASHVQLVRTGAEKRGGGFVGITVDQPQEQFIAANAPWAQQVNIWVTPHGFLENAMASNNATVKSGGKNLNVVTYTVEDKYKVNGYINDQNLVEKVETWIDNPVRRHAGRVHLQQLQGF